MIQQNEEAQDVSARQMLIRWRSGTERRLWRCECSDRKFFTFQDSIVREKTSNSSPMRARRSQASDFTYLGQNHSDGCSLSRGFKGEEDRLQRYLELDEYCNAYQKKPLDTLWPVWVEEVDRRDLRASDWERITIQGTGFVDCSRGYLPRE